MTASARQPSAGHPQPPSGDDGDRDHEEHPDGEDDDRAARGRVGVVRDPHAAHDDGDAEPIEARRVARKLPADGLGRRDGHDHQGADQQHADDPHRHHDGQGRQHGQQEVEPHDGQAGGPAYSSSLLTLNSSRPST